MKKNEYSTMFHFEDNYWWYRGLHGLIEYFVNKFSGNDISKKILDAGCGTGKMLKILEKYNFSEGIDISEEAIDFSKQRGLKNVSLQDLTTWHSKPNYYDFIISSDVICCIKSDKDIEICQNFYNSLSQNGKLILNLPAMKILGRNHDKAVYIAQRYERKNFVNELKKIGFKVKLATYRLPILYFIILILKIFEPKSTNETAVSDLKTIPKFANAILLINNKIENFFIKLGFRFPFGSSLFIIAEKNN